MTEDFHKRVVVGVEIEAYSIDVHAMRISRRLSRPRRGLSEAGERFTRDSSIGSEYNSRPFHTVREAFFLLKAGLRKYLRHLYRGRNPSSARRAPLLVGGWRDRFAGAHLHFSLEGRRLALREAASLSGHLHDQLPLLIAAGANSPVWHDQLTGRASVRLLRGSGKYFRVTRRGRLRRADLDEMVFNGARKTKPPTLELRVLDSNLPEYLVSILALAKAVALRWERGRGAANRMRDSDYRRARLDAAARGPRCSLPWRGRWLPFPAYLDRFLWEHREELEAMDIPEEIWETLRLLKRGYGGARLLHDAVARAKEEHPQTWEPRFARRYLRGLESLLSGNSLRSFAGQLGVELPSTENVWLGRKGAPLDA